jgi:hypothetical protein
MSFAAAALEGVRRAAVYAAMLFSFDVAPAAARPPEAALVIADSSVLTSGLTLAAHHVDVRIAGDSAVVRSALLLGNDSGTAVAVQYLLPTPARVTRGDALHAPGGAEAAAAFDEDDLSRRAAEAAEAGAGALARPRDVILVAPAERITVQVQQRLPLAVLGSVRRLQLPLPVDREAPWLPRFTADVRVDAERPVRRLASFTHPAFVDGLGGRTATLSVEEGEVHREAQLGIEFELAPPAPVLALDARGPATR